LFAYYLRRSSFPANRVDCDYAVVIVFQMPFIIIQFSRLPSSGVNYIIATLISGIAGVFLGHVVRRETAQRFVVAKGEEVKKSIRRSDDKNAALLLLERQFRDFGFSNTVEIYLFDEQGNLKNYKDMEETALPMRHIYYDVAARREFIVSNFVQEASRFNHFGPTEEKGLVKNIAVFPIEYGGIPRGVISVVNSAHEYFNDEAVHFLISVKQSVERVLEIAENQRLTIQSEIQREKIRNTFSSYVSRSVAEEILKDPDKVDLGGTLHDVTVLFTEVINFQELQETLDPSELVAMLNEYFSLSIDAVFEFDGTLDKFIGDNVMAFWGAPLPMPDCEQRALHCATRIQKNMEQLNLSWKQRGKESFNICVGINSGKAIAGNIGSIRRMEYTVIGDTVNVTARIKTLSKTKNIPILVSESTYTKVKDQFRFGDKLQAAVKGKSDIITVYQLL